MVAKLPHSGYFLSLFLNPIPPNYVLHFHSYNHYRTPLLTPLLPISTYNPLQGVGSYTIPQPKLIIFDQFSECFGGHGSNVEMESLNKY